MAKKLTKAEIIRKMISEGETDNKVIAAAADCTVQYVKNIKSSDATRREMEGTEDEFFYRVPKEIEEEPEPSEEEPDHDYDYECAVCHHKWDSKEDPTCCPNCGVEF